NQRGSLKSGKTIRRVGHVSGIEILINRVSRLLVGTEYMGAKQFEGVGLIGIEMLDIEDGAVVGQTWRRGKINDGFGSIEIAQGSLVHLRGAGGDFGWGWTWERSRARRSVEA